MAGHGGVFVNTVMVHEVGRTRRGNGGDDGGGSGERNKKYQQMPFNRPGRQDSTALAPLVWRSVLVLHNKSLLLTFNTKTLVKGFYVSRLNRNKKTKSNQAIRSHHCQAITQASLLSLRSSMGLC
jgi:hypothetical protein